MKVPIILGLIGLVLQSQSRNICWPLAAVAWAAKETDRGFKQYGFVFLLGALSDLVSGRLLGASAILFVGMLLVIDLLKLRFKASLKLNLALAIVFQMVYLVLVNFGHF